MSSSISSAQSTLSGAAAINSAAEATNLSQLMSEQAIWLVPVTLVAVQFFLKLFVAESPSFRQAWKSLIHSPVDVGFLALSFIATVIMGSPNSTNGLLAPMFGYIVFIVFSIVITKVSPTEMRAKPMVLSSFLIVLNYVMVSSMLVFSVSKMIGE
ncbi:hypothetical protein [Vibrio parahaemolyticus]|uniref:hypothetical protein n=1 Tax=Vibrio parahaemolyticus TaxID=670 RepID=UPI0038919BB7